MRTFQKSYALPVGAYLWVPLSAGLAMLVVVGVMAPIVVLIAAPLLAFMVGLPSWILGGRVLVRASRDFVRFDRQRFGWTHVRQLALFPGETPAVEVRQPHSHRPFGVLRVTSRAGYIEVQNAPLAALRPIASDLDQLFRT